MAKQLTVDQCLVLHPIYGQNDCCLCKANQQIKELEAKVKELEAKVAEKRNNGLL